MLKLNIYFARKYDSHLQEGYNYIFKRCMNDNIIGFSNHYLSKFESNILSIMFTGRSFIHFIGIYSPNSENGLINSAVLKKCLKTIIRKYPDYKDYIPLPIKVDHVYNFNGGTNLNDEF